MVTVVSSDRMPHAPGTAAGSRRPGSEKRVELVYFNAGGGHRAAALALQAVIEQQERGWSVQLTDLVQVLDPNANFRRVMGMAPEALYNRRLESGWTLGLAQELKLLQGAIRLGHKALLRPLQQHWARGEPDLVVSLVPNFNRVLYESVSGSLPGVPFITVMTDIADHPPHFWIEPGQAQTIVCGSVRAAAQARAAGYGPGQIVHTSGMVLRPAFYDLQPFDRDSARAALGLEPGRPTAVVMFGGHGSRQMVQIAKLLDGVQLVLMCGRNEPLAARLRRLRRSAPQAVLGFTDDVCRVMRLGDFFIGKPGPGCLSEAVHLGLPVITTRNAWTMPQERYNTEWVREMGVGLVIPALHRLPAAVEEMCRRLPELQAATAAIQNRAVFEIVDRFADCLEASSRPVDGAPAHAPPRPVYG